MGRGQYIRWEDKVQFISPETWCTANPNERLARAREDLKRSKALTAEQAEQLTSGQLYTAWQKLHSTLREQYSRAREAGKGATVTQSLGLKAPPVVAPPALPSAPRQASAEGGLEDDVEVASVAPFTIEIEVAQETSAEVQKRCFRHPLCNGVIIETSFYERDLSPFLLLRVPSAGLQSEVGEPYFPEEGDLSTVHIVVSRANSPDFVEMLLEPGADQRIKDAKKAQISSMLVDSFGKHASYALINRALQDLAPERETWTVVVTVSEPYMFDEDFSKTVFCKAARGADSLIALPLACQKPASQRKRPKVVSMSSPQLEEQPAGEAGSK